MRQGEKLYVWYCNFHVKKLIKNQKLLLSKLFSHLAKNIKKEIDEGLKIVLNIYEHQKNNKQKLRKEKKNNQKPTEHVS